jgi:hypothetical protein
MGKDLAPEEVNSSGILESVNMWPVTALLVTSDCRLRNLKSMARVIVKSPMSRLCKDAIDEV